MNKPRIIFAGTPEFALASLTALVEAGHNVVAVYTQPDRPAGRGRKTKASAVKIFAAANDILVMQPQTLRAASAADELRAIRPDLMIVAAYGLILPQEILDIPRFGCLNVHASILPRWRGAAPIQAAILANDAATGVSLMKMTAGLDCGPVYSTRQVELVGRESAAAVHDQLAALGAELLLADLDKILSGSLLATEQDEALTCYAPKIEKQDAELDWKLPAAEVHRRIRAYNPAPGAFFFHDVGSESVRIKIWQASLLSDVFACPGSITKYDREGIVIACDEGALSLETLQLPGKRRATAAEFVTQINISVNLSE